MRRIWIDCSCVAAKPHLRTGIQRCVRELSRQLLTESPSGVDSVRLLRFDANTVQELSLDDIEFNEGLWSEQGSTDSGNVARYDWRYYFDRSTYFFACLLPITSWRRFWRNPSNLPGFRRICVRWYYQTKPSTEVAEQNDATHASSVSDRDGVYDSHAAIEIDSEHFLRWVELHSLSSRDVLLLLDSSWSIQIWHAARAFKARGVRVVSVIYDLIPLQYPEAVPDELTPIFRRWLDRTLLTCDGAICISNTVTQDVHAYTVLMRHLGAQNKPIRSFYLGSNLQMPESVGSGVTMEHIFRFPTFLMVGTLEPRKNHQFVLDAFEHLWSRGAKVNLLIIGRIGFQAEPFVQRVRKHPMSSQHLYLYPGGSEDLLLQAYQRSRALIFASYAEGFGLPLMEALALDLPVIASDIEIHREIGGEALMYFPLERKHALAELIERFRLEPACSTKHAKAPGLICWKESATQLIQAIDEIIDEIPKLRCDKQVADG